MQLDFLMSVQSINISFLLFSIFAVAWTSFEPSSKKKQTSHHKKDVYFFNVQTGDAL